MAEKEVREVQSLNLYLHIAVVKERNGKLKDCGQSPTTRK